MAIEGFHRSHRNVLTKQALPLVETAPGCGSRILGIKRQEDNLVTICLAQKFDRLSREWMPVTHCHETMCVNTVGPELSLERLCLLLGETPYRRSSADSRIVVLHFLCPRGRNQLGQRLAS